jgi:hypothetical protein
VRSWEPHLELAADGERMTADSETIHLAVKRIVFRLPTFRSRARRVRIKGNPLVRSQTLKKRTLIKHLGRNN